MSGAADPRPRPMGDERRHYWLVQGMAKATGVDLAAAMAEGKMTQAGWARIVTRCRGCQWAEDCADWLERPVETTQDFPEPCLNRNRLAAMRAKPTDPAPQEE